MRIQNKKGLSAIVATLIIILLTLVAVGIIWAVIRNLVEGGAGQVDLSSKCLNVELSGVNVTENALIPGNYSVTLRRGSDSQDDIGVKIAVFKGATENSGVLEFGDFGNLDALGTVTKPVVTVAPALITEGDSIQFTAYFQDTSGDPQLCSHTYTYSF